MGMSTNADIFYCFSVHSKVASLAGRDKNKSKQFADFFLG
jgi:hypothetical protein